MDIDEPVRFTSAEKFPVICIFEPPVLLMLMEN
jgi:hypothetical protein